ncbi:hypothetical protein [Apilactobacillus xinyiensis]|uniref:Lipoprotein n=1 Tax=Apilactobacillus xinyiensis TaxID=2841032 RepID=A0ABT0I2W0_9LACO|nr:hypothetical protein [Apilactobacillus xinyiensis]MCK8625080.1 hypothetical protein [Apilactobacillus xinyiensis]MCL0318892.1 hypothetical protein [Apilactobacillus xinyiensis]
MKKWIYSIVSIVVICLIGFFAFGKFGGNKTENKVSTTTSKYDSYIKAGKQHVQDESYTVAKSDFQNALKQKPGDKKADLYLNQTENFDVASQLFNKERYRAAKVEFGKVVDTKNGLSILVQRANDKIKSIEKAQSTIAKFSDIYDKAMNEFKAGNYKSSLATLNEIFKDDAINEKYYKDVLSAANKLKQADKKALNGENNVEVSSPDFESNLTNNSSDNNSSNTNSSNNTNNSSSQNSEAKYKGSNEYTVKKSDKELNGNKISDSDIQSARRSINKAGVYADSMSDQDVRNTIKAANKKGVSVQEYAQTVLK